MGERKFIFLGCHFDGELIAAGVFGSTITDPVKKLGTSQLFFFKEVKGNSSPSRLDSFLSFYIERYHPADIFVESTVAEKDCLQYSLLLTQEENSENFFWKNTELTFYTYKITSLKSRKYYYGVSHVKKASATLEDCLNDGYFGSGGKDSKNKFFNWKKKYADSLEKEVLELHVNKAEAYSYESELISDKWITDKNCLNSRAGGFVVPNHRISYILKECAVHGATLHAGESCKKCVARKGLQLKRCETHGETVHQGKHCKKCIANKRNSFKICGVHGRTLHTENAQFTSKTAFFKEFLELM